MNTDATSSLLASMYGYSTAGSLTGSASLSPSVAARVQLALQGQKGTIDALNANLTASQTRLSGLGQLKSALDAFDKLAEGLAGAGLSTAATVSTKDILTPTTTASAKPGTYKVVVDQLAQGQVLNSGTQLSADTKLGSGATATVRLQWGTVGKDGFDPTNGSGKTITIDSSNNTLDGIAAALKEAGVDASVVKADGGYKLQIRGESGAAQNLSIGVTGDAALKAAIGFDPAQPGATGMAQVQAAQDALISVDGVAVKASTNAIADAVPGTTLNLTGKGTTTVTVTQDSSQIAKNVAAFVQGYNDLSAKLTALQKGALKDDQALAQVSTQLASLMRVGGAGASAQALADAGLSRKADGTLVLDETKLKAAIAADPEAVSKLFTNDGRGLADKLDSRIDGLTGAKGLLTRATTQTTRNYETLSDRKDKLAQSLTVQAQALAQMYTIQEQMGGTGSLLDLLG